MNILIVHNVYKQRGGEDAVVESEAELLESHGHNVTRFLVSNDEVDNMGHGEVLRDAVWNRRRAIEIRQVMETVKPEIVHVHNTFMRISPSVYWVAEQCHVPVVQTVHNYRLICPNALLLRDGRPCEDCVKRRIAWPGVIHGCYRGSRVMTAAVAAMLAFHRVLGTWERRVNRFIALTNFAKCKMIEGGMSADRIVIKPNFVHTDSAASTARGNYAMFVGRLSPEKGLDILLEAWKRLPDRVPLKIVGDGPLAGRVSEAVKQDSRIEWLGWQPGKTVLSLLSEASFVVMASVCYETFGRIIIEAFATGTPAVVSNLGAMAELVDHGRTGYLFQAGNASDLVAKIQQGCQNKSERERMRTACREEYERKYTASVNYRRLMESYEQVVESR